MANPSPAHNPTDGLGTAAYITLTDSAAVLTKVGSQVALSPGNRVGGNQYKMTLSLGGLTPPYTYQASTILNAVVVDVKGNTFATGNGDVVKYRTYPAQGIVGCVVSVSQNGAVTPTKVGQEIIEAYFPTFDNTDGVDFIYAQVICTIVP